MSFVTCHRSCVTCNMLGVTCHLSPITYHLSPVTCLPRPKIPIFFENLKTHRRAPQKKFFLKLNISNMSFDQRSLVHREASFPGCDRQTYIDIDGHRNLLTESA